MPVELPRKQAVSEKRDYSVAGRRGKREAAAERRRQEVRRFPPWSWQVSSLDCESLMTARPPLHWPAALASNPALARRLLSRVTGLLGCVRRSSQRQGAILCTS
jgi:hypothetical protein